MKQWVLLTVAWLSVVQAVKVDMRLETVQPGSYAYYRLAVAKNGGSPHAFCVKMYFTDVEGKELDTPVEGGSAPNEWDGSWSVKQAFDDKRHTYCSHRGNPTGWLQYKFPNSVRLSAYSLSHYWGGTTYNLVAWTFEGSNDGTTWKVLDTKTDQPLKESEKKIKFSLPTTPVCTGDSVSRFQCDKLEDRETCLRSFYSTAQRDMFLQCGWSGTQCLTVGPLCQGVVKPPGWTHYRLVVTKNGGGPGFCVKMYFTDLTGTELDTPVEGGSAPNEWDGSWSVKQAFDDKRHTYCSHRGNPTGWLQYKFPNSVRLSAYSLSHYWGGTTYNLVAWTFEGSNDGTTWKVLDTKTDQPLKASEKKIKFSLPIDG